LEKGWQFIQQLLLAEEVITGCAASDLHAQEWQEQTQTYQASQCPGADDCVSSMKRGNECGHQSDREQHAG
jgi:hypothetical protein